ncbi:sigma-70 family RNA polymerase sigma factor [Luxibacter massiliensis]|uniref:sigma-70 family RNA polymerase sigma factor n=1 Tax=Luxibacter massiliensis TaxID=2219695 RepID=UPI000F06425B|nr:FliA/WhiG family RNA polymerase sigma factor [Luxibacter massiliensis]
MNTQEVYSNKSNEELLQLYKETDSLEIKQELVMRYIYLVKSIALQMRDIYMSFSQVDDIINEGVIAIMSAIDKFDLEKNVKFETYISKRIKGMIIDLARKQDWVPRSTRKNTRDIEEAVSTLYNKLGYYPSVQEVTEYLNITQEKYQESMRKAALFNVLSLDMVLAEAQENKSGVRLPQGEESEQPENQLLRKETAEVLAQGISELKENEQLVVSLYYIDELNMRQIAEILQVSEPRISQIHTNAIKKLRKYMQKFNEERESKNVSRIL